MRLSPFLTKRMGKQSVGWDGGDGCGGGGGDGQEMDGKNVIGNPVFLP